MHSAPPELDQRTWRHLFEVGEGVLSRRSLYDQAEFLIRELSSLTGAEIDLWLLERFKPLPSQTNSNDGQTDVSINFEKEFLPSSFNNKEGEDGFFYDVPIEKGTSILGKIRFSYPESVDLSTDFKDFLKITGGFIGSILDTARLSALKDWRYDQLSLVRNVIFEITRYRNTAELFRKIVDLVQGTFHFYFVAIYTFTGDNSKLKVQANAGKTLTEAQTEALNFGDGIPLGKGLIGMCAETGREILSPDVEQDSRYRFVDGLDDAQSEICLPLISNEKPLGVLQIISDNRTAFHDNDIMVLQILADAIATAIENADLFDSLFEKTWASTVMLQVAEAAQAYDDIDDLLEAIVRILPLMVGVNKCAIFTRGKFASEFYLNAHHGFDKDIEPKLAMLPYDQEAAERFHQVAVLKIPLDLEHSILNGSKQEDKNSPNCCKLVPMVAHDKLFGILMVDHSVRIGNINEDAAAGQQDVALAIGRQIALAIENFELEESREYEAYITAVLLQVAEMVAAAENLDETLANVINLLPLVVGVDTALVYLLDEHSKRVHLRSAYSRSWKEEVDNLPQSIKNGFSRSLELVSLNQKPVFCQLGDLSPANWLQFDYRPFLRNNHVPKTPEPALAIFPLFIGNENFGFPDGI